MRKLVTTLFGVAVLACTAGMATAQTWLYPPGPPYRSCPDTLDIYDIQQTDTTIAPCHPATLDTVWGVQGIVTGMDTKASAFGFYIQIPGGGPRTGVLAFTGATNWAGLGISVGDLVAVYGTTQEFPATNGETEIEGPDRSQSTNDIVVRKISSGNPLPQDVVTTSQINWVPGLSQGEEWEGGFLKVRGPLVVARTSGSPALGSGAYLVVNPSNPLDSMLVDAFNFLPSVPAPPPVGTVIDSVQGILTHRDVFGINAYRLQIRDGNDVFLAAPPNLVDAFPVEDNVLRLVFDRDVDVATAEDEGNYSLASGIDGSTVDLAQVEGGSGRAVLLTITSVRVDGDQETVSAVNIGSAGCPSCLMTPQQSRTFINGVLSIADVQAPDPAFLPSFDDRSRFAGTGTGAGTRLSFRGVCTGQYGSLFAMQDEAGGPRSGIYVFGPSIPLVRGTKYLFVGQVQEFFNLTEGVNSVYILDEGAGTIPAPAVVPVAVLRDTTTDQTQSVLTGEDYEAVLVRLPAVQITENRTLGQSFFATETPARADTILVQNLNGALSAYDSPDSATTMDITGTTNFSFGTFRVAPRDPADITELGLNVSAPPAGAGLSFAVAPNPARTPRMTFSLPARGDVEIGVFDLQGRRIAQVAKDSYGAGVHSLEWDGRDTSGRRVGAGVYFYNFRFGTESRVVRGVVLQ